MNNALLKTIDELLLERGESRRSACINAGLGADFIRNIERRPHAEPRHANLVKLAQYLGTTVRHLTGAESGGAKGPAVSSLTGEEETEADHAVAFNLRRAQEQMPADLPVYGTAGASFAVQHEGAFEMEARVIEYVRRPPSLTNVPDSYGIFIAGTSMEPALNQGDLQFVHPHRPPRVGNLVLVQTQIRAHEGIEAFVGYYQRTTADHVVVRKLNPPSEVAYLRNTIRYVHKVLTINDLFGV